MNTEAFTACALGVSRLQADDFERWHLFKGRSDKKNGPEDVDGGSFFDLASLTKPLVTVLCVLSLVREGRLSFEETLDSLLPVDIPADKKEIRLSQLLGHRSGLPSHREYFRKAARPAALNCERLIRDILQEVLENKPGKRFLYSDLDYMLLGEIIKWKSGESIESYWRREIAGPLGISEKFSFFGTRKGRENSAFVCTGQCLWTDRPLRGQVHDDNCRAVGELMGHAGAFANLDGVLFLCEEILLNFLGKKAHPAYAQEDLISLFKAESDRYKAGAFDVVSGSTPSSGKYFSRETIGHLGFTGTSFWIDLKKKIIVVLLTNRVIYGFENKKIQEVRPHVHDTVMKQLMENNHF